MMPVAYWNPNTSALALKPQRDGYWIPLGVIPEPKKFEELDLMDVAEIIGTFFPGADEATTRQLEKVIAEAEDRLYERNWVEQ
jgi:hypothetical protein